MAASSQNEIFAGRREAGAKLAARLSRFAAEHPIVVAMPRGGVPVAAEVAAALDAPLDIAVVRKLGAPRQPELAIGAIAEEGAVVIDHKLVSALRIGRDEIDEIREREGRELARRAALYRSVCPKVDLDGRVAVLIDDGLATGATAIAAARSLRSRGASRVVLAVPVCPQENSTVPPDAAIDELVWLIAPARMQAVGYWYANFPQVSDAEVLDDLRRSATAGNSPPVGDVY